VCQILGWESGNASYDRGAVRGLSFGQLTLGGQARPNPAEAINLSGFNAGRAEAPSGLARVQFGRVQGGVGGG